MNINKSLKLLFYKYLQFFVTTQDFSPPAAARPFMCELRSLRPAAAKTATHTKPLRTAVGSEESTREQTCRVTIFFNQQQNVFKSKIYCLSLPTNIYIKDPMLWYSLLQRWFAPAKLASTSRLLPRDLCVILVSEYLDIAFCPRKNICLVQPIVHSRALAATCLIARSTNMST